MLSWEAVGNLIISPADATYGHGIYVYGVTCPSKISLNDIYDAGKYGIFNEGSSNIKYTGNTIKNADSYGYYNSQGDNVDFVGNSIYADAAEAAILNAVDDNIFNSNKIYVSLNTAHGLDMQGAGNRNIVTGNQIRGGGIANNAIGIYDRAGTGDYIGDNLVSNFQYGIWIHSDCDRTVAYGKNQVEGCASGTSVYDDRTETAETITLEPEGPTSFDTTSNAIAATLPDGEYIGQIKTVVLTTDGGNDVTLTVTHHLTSDPEVFTLQDAGDGLAFIWLGTWHTLYNNGATT